MERRICLLAHNVRSLWNVGSFFRTGDGIGIEKIYLTGYTGVPPRKEISKTSLGADEWVAWEQHADPVLLLQDLRKDGWSIAALEQLPGSISLMDYDVPAKVCLIVGNELTGVSADLIAPGDDVIEIPMLGKKESLNVAVAAGIALHRLRTA